MLNKGNKRTEAGRPGGLPAMAAPKSGLRPPQNWRYGRGTALHYLYAP